MNEIVMVITAIIPLINQLGMGSPTLPEAVLINELIKEIVWKGSLIRETTLPARIVAPSLTVNPSDCCTLVLMSVPREVVFPRVFDRLVMVALYSSGMLPA